MYAILELSTTQIESHGLPHSARLDEDLACDAHRALSSESFGGSRRNNVEFDSGPTCRRALVY
jgi:hypothetical protein